MATRPRDVSGLAGAIVGGPGVVTVERRSEGHVTAIEASHDGYAARGLIHRRILMLDGTGRVLHGEDMLLDALSGGAEPDSVPFVLRFHLHPAVRATTAADGRGVVLTHPRDSPWRFEAGGLAVSVEESIYFGSAEGPRRTGQIVVRGETSASRSVRWSLSAENDA